MINLQNIINSSLITVPWEHKIVENFYEADSFERFFQAASHLQQYAEEEKVISIYPFKLKNYGLGDETYELMISSANCLLKNLKEILKNFPEYSISHSGYCCIPHFAITGRNFRFPIHCDSFDRVLTAIIYVSDGDHKGTLLYKNKTDENFHSEIGWKQNRAFLMCPELNKPTWHTWENYTTDYRISLNYSCHKIEKLHDILNTTRDEDREGLTLWLLEELNNGNCVINDI